MKIGNSSISKNFTLFILVSVVFWFLTKLSKEYESTVVYPVSYENLPSDKLLQEEPEKEISIHIKATGFKIISGKLLPKTLKINASNLLLKSKTNYYLLLSQQRLSIQRQMNAGVSIDHFIKDSVGFDLGFLGQKKVPVKLNANFTFEAGYDMEGAIKLTPDSVVVSGPESILDTISFVETSPLVKNDLNASIKQDLTLRSFANTNNINLNVNSIDVDAKIEKFTEGTLKVPFTIVNLPDSIQINTFPKEVNITYKVALSNFGKVQPSSFFIECDYHLSSQNNLEYLVPKLNRQSDLVKNVKITPNKIEFVIEK